jgi:uncharacterized coiled-coil protein SlyX
MKRAAADLIWSASAKVTREERAEVIRRLPPLLKQLREGMTSAGMDAAKQDEQIQQLNNSLAAAFTAKAAVIPDDRLRELMERLETLEELLPDAAEHRDRRIDGARPVGPPELRAGDRARRRLDAHAGDGGLGA